MLTALLALATLWSLPLIAIAWVLASCVLEDRRERARELEWRTAGIAERAARDATRPTGSVAEVIPLYPRAVRDRRGGAA